MPANGPAQSWIVVSAGPMEQLSSWAGPMSLKRHIHYRVKKHMLRCKIWARIGIWGNLGKALWRRNWCSGSNSNRHGVVTAHNTTNDSKSGPSIWHCWAIMELSSFCRTILITSDYCYSKRNNWKTASDKRVQVYTVCTHGHPAAFHQNACPDQSYSFYLKIPVGDKVKSTRNRRSRYSVCSIGQFLKLGSISCIKKVSKLVQSLGIVSPRTMYENCLFRHFKAKHQRLFFTAHIIHHTQLTVVVNCN